MVPYPAALDLPHTLVEWMTMLIVTREGDRRCKLPPSQRAITTLIHPREHTTYAKPTAGFRISEDTAHTYVPSVIRLLASRTPPLTQALRRARPEYALVDGTIAQCDQVGDRERNHSGKARRHGANIQAVTGPAGELIRYSPALPGRTTDITTARTHHIITVCQRLRIPILTDKAYVTAGGTFQVPFKRHLGPPSPPDRQPPTTHTRLRFPLERAFARLKTQRTFHKARTNPNRPTSTTKTILTLEKRH
ncbi:transposase family protein [Streptomyces sp. NPDC088752]|uniref:transposase family protein n=1 Tax=Streptomyces sp. NPDC088752 TaxID=3154963 RepID=UPI0034256A07